MKWIELTQDKRACVDDEDYERLSRAKWCYVKHVRSLLGSQIRRIKTNNPKTMAVKSGLLGYTPHQLKSHLEAQFEQDMSWENYGELWEIDHIKPVSKFKLGERLCIVNALENLRPLPKFENNLKSNKHQDVLDIKEALTFDDVQLLPQYSDVTTRNDADISVNLNRAGDLILRVPLISAPMDTVTQGVMALTMSSVGGLGIIHRYQTLKKRFVEAMAVKDERGIVGVAIGIKDDIVQLLDYAQSTDIDLLCLDVAHAHSKNVLEYTARLKDAMVDRGLGSVPLMVGNIATFPAALDLRLAGADIVKCGIGSGSICSTRQATGHGVPMLTAVMDIREALEGFTNRPKIIADGGHRFPSDIAKSLAAGADAIMLGSMLAGTPECPGDVIEENGKRYKAYRGMASKEAQGAWSGLKEGTSPEGVSARILMKESATEIVNYLSGCLRSALSYGGAFDLEEFYHKAEFVRISSAGTMEATTHIFNQEGSTAYK